MAPDSPADVVRPLLQVRQTRAFSDEPVDNALIDALTDAARWSGSNSNGQPWRFIVIRDPAVLRAIGEASLPARHLVGAPVAIAISVPQEEGMNLAHAYDEGRAAERILIAASLLGLGAGIAWIRSDVRATAGEILGLPADRLVRTIMALGHPTAAALRPKSAPGTARLPREELAYDERWPVRPAEEAG
jgi:nitroreductase